MSNSALLPAFDTFGELLRHLRRRARLTQRDLGLAVGYSDAHITRLERGHRLPDLTAVKGLFVEALGLEHEPELSKYLLELAVKVRREPPSLTGQKPTLAASPPKRTNLVAQQTCFMGRQREMEEVKHLLGESRLVTLTGAGGVGKTRLGLAVAASLQRVFSDGVWAIELADVLEPAQLLQTITSAFNLLNESSESSESRFMGSSLDDITCYLATKHALLILDQCEHLIATCAAFAMRLLRDCPHLHVIITSRETLRIAGEMVYRVPSLTVPTRIQHAENLGHYESVQLFIERARLSQPIFALTDNNARAVALVSRRLDGIPLAIELAAAQVKQLSVEQIALQLEQRFHSSGAAIRTAQPPHKTIRTTLDWIYDLLSDSERTLIRNLSVFKGSFGITDVESKCGTAAHDYPLREAHAGKLLTQLSNKALVLVIDDQGQTHYRLPEPIREYALVRSIAHRHAVRASESGGKDRG